MLVNTFTGTVTGFNPSAAARPGGGMEPVAGVVEAAGEDGVEVVEVAGDDGVEVVAGDETPLVEVLPVRDPSVVTAGDAAVAGDAFVEDIIGDATGVDPAAAEEDAADDCPATDVDDAEPPVDVLTAVAALPEQPLTASPTSTTPMPYRRS